MSDQLVPTHQGPSRDDWAQFAAIQQGRWQRWSTVSAAPPLTDKCKGATAERVRELQTELSQRLQHVQGVHERLTSAAKALREAEARVLAEVNKDIETMSDGVAVEQAHADALKTLEDYKATQQLHDQRLQRTTAAAEQAQTQLDLFVTEHWQELSEALTSDANDVSERAKKLAAEYERKLAPIRQEWNAIWTTQAEIIGRTPELVASDLPAPDDYAQPPVVSDEALARFRALTSPESIEPEQDAA
jgi:hypothetical protein